MPLPASIVRDLVAAEYDLGRPTGCTLLSSGWGDVYAVEFGADRRALRIHGLDKWWIGGEGDFRFELDLLRYLADDGVPVSAPVPRRNGELLGPIDDRRRYSLFTWAAGEPGARTPEKTWTVGRTVARIHLSADGFSSRYGRYRLDLDTLLRRSLRVKDLSTESAADAEFLREQVSEVERRMQEFDPGPSGWGIVHGDVQPLNFHFDETNAITFFDFDFCGYGWRLYDVATYVTRIRTQLRRPFLDGYESVRPMSAAEHDLIATMGRLAWIREGGVESTALVDRLREPYVSFD